MMDEMWGNVVASVHQIARLASDRENDTISVDHKQTLDHQAIDWTPEGQVGIEVAISCSGKRPSGIDEKNSLGGESIEHLRHTGQCKFGANAMPAIDILRQFRAMQAKRRCRLHDPLEAGTGSVCDVHRRAVIKRPPSGTGFIRIWVLSDQDYAHIGRFDVLEGAQKMAINVRSSCACAGQRKDALRDFNVIGDGTKICLSAVEDFLPRLRQVVLPICQLLA